MLDYPLSAIEPYLRFLRWGYLIVLTGVTAVCFVDFVQRLRSNRLQFSLRHPLLLMLLAAHAGSIGALARSSPELARRMDQWPIWLSAPAGLVLPLYIFGPVGLLFAFGCYEGAQGRPYYLLVALLYLVSVRWIAALAA